MHIEELVNFLIGQGKQWKPIRYGHFEPLKHAYNGDAKLISREIEHGNVLWRSENSFALVGRYVQGYKFGSLALELAAECADSVQWESFMSGLALRLKPTLCVLHYLNEYDLEEDKRSGVRVEAADEPFFGVYAQTLSAGLPNCYWGMVLGPEYTNLFGIEELLNTPGQRTLAIGRDMVYVQLTSKLSDCINNRQDFERARGKARKHIGLKAFYRQNRLLDALDTFVGASPLVPILKP